MRSADRAEQRTARVMGAWFLGTFVFSIPAFFFYTPVLDHPDQVSGAGADGAVGVGALLEVLLAVSCIATAVVIFPVARRVSEGVALGYVAARTVEALLILVGVLALREGAPAGGPDGVLLGWWVMDSAVPVALTAPEVAWELSLTIWLLLKGFRPSPVLSGSAVG